MIGRLNPFFGGFPLALRESLICIQEKLEHFINIKSALGVGEPVNQFSLCHFSYKEALSVLENHVVSPGIRFYDKQKSIHRIAENVSKEEMAYFCESILKELAYPTNPTDLELRRTLATYLDSQCKIVETAEKYFYIAIRFIIALRNAKTYLMHQLILLNCRCNYASLFICLSQMIKIERFDIKKSQKSLENGRDNHFLGFLAYNETDNDVKINSLC